MNTKPLAAVLVASTPFLAFGTDGSVAQLTGIHGHVLLSTGHLMASATEPIRLVPGIRVLPTAESSAEVAFDDGCRVTVGPGQRYEVDREPPCRRASTDESESRAMETPR